MKYSKLLIPALMTLSLSACFTMPAGPPGTTGSTGARGNTGARGSTTGDTMVIVPAR